MAPLGASVGLCRVRLRTAVAHIGSARVRELWDAEPPDIHGVANVVSNKTKYKNQAWEFVKYLGSQPAAEILGKKGPIPAYTGTQAAWKQANATFNGQVFLDAVSYAVPYPVSRNTAAWNEAETKHLTRAYNGEVDIEAAAKALAAEMNDLLAKE